MNNQEIKEIGLFRFSLIAAIVNDTYEACSKMQYYRNMTAKEHKHPNGEKVKYASETIKSWHMSYIKHGIDGLLPKKRSDSGMPRTFSRKAIEKIHDIKEQYPHITTKMVYQKLIEDGYIKASTVSLSSVYRYIRDNNLKRNQISPVERKAYEMEHSNDCWQADTTHAAKIIVDGKKVQTYLIAIIDDCSRLCLHAEFFLNDNAVNLQIALKKAVKKYGIPRKFFVDNGAPYKNGQLNLICASLGLVLIHTKIYSPQSKGKIERMFRTVKDGYLNCTDWNEFTSLADLNNKFNIYLNEEYQNKRHSSTKETPRSRYLKDSALIKRKTEEDIEACFLHRIQRTVRNDATISLNTFFFEVPQKYIKQRINIRYTPDALTEAYIYNDQNELTDVVYPLKKVDNSKIKRKSIDYSQIPAGGKKNV